MEAMIDVGDILGPMQKYTTRNRARMLLAADERGI